MCCCRSLIDVLSLHDTATRNFYYFEYDFALEISLKVSGFVEIFFSICYFTLDDTVVVLSITSFSPTMVSSALPSDIKTLSFVISTKPLPKGFSIIKICNSSLEEKNTHITQTPGA